MFATRTILCPTDFFACSRCAFRLARALARAHGARLIVLHVNQTPQPMVVCGENSAEGRAVEHPAELWRALRRLRSADGNVPIEHRILAGDPAQEILRLAADTGSDLIVMGTHGRTGMARVLMGSVAEQVTRQASCPVITFRLPLHRRER